MKEDAAWEKEKKMKENAAWEKEKNLTLLLRTRGKRQKAC